MEEINHRDEHMKIAPNVAIHSFGCEHVLSCATNTQCRAPQFSKVPVQRKMPSKNTGARPPRNSPTRQPPHLVRPALTLWRADALPSVCILTCFEENNRWQSAGEILELRLPLSLHVQLMDNLKESTSWPYLALKGTLWGLTKASPNNTEPKQPK